MVIEAEHLEFVLPQVRVHAQAWGPDDGRLALCVHGFPDCADSWRKVGPLLAERGFRVVAPYLRGYHPSSPAGDDDYGIGAQMSDAIALHDQLGAPDNAVLIGHDWGGWMCNAMAALPTSPFAEHISLAIPPVPLLAVSQLPLAARIPAGLRQMRSSWYIMFFQLPVRPDRRLLRIIPRLWRDWSPPGADVDQGVTDALAAMPGPENRSAAVAYYRAMFRNRRPAPANAALHDFRLRKPVHPLLTLHGVQDGALFVGYTTNLEDKLPEGSRVRTIEGAGHFLQLDQPRAVADEIIDYVSRR